MSVSKIASTCVSKTYQRTHLFRIKGYSKHMAESDFIVSDTFSIGEHGWKLLICPDGSASCSDEEDCIGAALLLLHKSTKAQSFVEIELRLLDQSTGRSLSVHKEASSVIDSYVPYRFALCVIKRKLFEETSYIQDDCLTIESIVTVISKPQDTETKQLPRIEVPPSDIGDHFVKLLETKEGVDVTFSVGGVDFTAHKMVLATRSPVFRAELYGPMTEGRSDPIVVEDIQPDVFSALLHFMYSDSLPDFDDLFKADDYVEMIRHLLVAADRYAMERLKLVYQSILCRSLHVQTVATTLALADQHQCDMLKDACIEFVTSSNAMDDVAATQGYKSLKRTCPFVVIELLEKTSRLRKA